MALHTAGRYWYTPWGSHAPSAALNDPTTPQCRPLACAPSRSVSLQVEEASEKGIRAERRSVALRDLRRSEDVLAKTHQYARAAEVRAEGSVGP